MLRIKNIHSKQPVVSMEYADDGHVLMGSSVAAPYEGKLLIGCFPQSLILSSKIMPLITVA